MRSICGMEAMMLQAFPSSMLGAAAAALPFKDPMELAGNSFNGLVVAAVFTAIFMDLTIADNGQGAGGRGVSGGEGAGRGVERGSQGA